MDNGNYSDIDHEVLEQVNRLDFIQWSGELVCVLILSECKS